MTIYSGYTQSTWWFSIAMLIYQRVDQYIIDDHRTKHLAWCSENWNRVGALETWMPLRHIISVNLCPWARLVPCRHGGVQGGKQTLTMAILLDTPKSSNFTGIGIYWAGAGRLPYSIHRETLLCAYVEYVCVPDSDSFLDILHYQVPIRGSLNFSAPFFSDYIFLGWGGLGQSAAHLEDVR